MTESLTLLKQGRYSEASKVADKSLKVAEKAFGTNHPTVGISLNILASSYKGQGKYDEAEPLFKRSLAIFEKALGPDHPSVASSLNNLAGLYESIGDYAKAEPLFKRSLTISEKALGPDHPDVANSLNNLAALYAALEDFDKAHGLFTRAQEIDSKVIDQVMGFTSEDQKMKFFALKKWNLAGFLTLVDRHLIHNPKARKNALNIWLRRKGVVLEAQRRFQEALVYSDNPKAVKTFQKLARVRAQLSELAF